ncbi:MAG TPA: hypothetical protein VG345_09240 [Bryobacteraceae bacterium]|nr:hypothetical protein [Bryobacteraceae bacterium]
MAQQIRVRASYPGLIRHQVGEIDASGFHLTAGPANSLSMSGGSLGLSRLVAENGSIEIVSSEPGHEPFPINIHKLVLTGAGGSHPKFQIAAAGMRPPGEFQAEGDIDRSRSNSLKMAGVSGRFHFNKVDLGVFGGISGTLDASGRIGGTIQQLRWDGRAVAPDFQVSGSAHRVRLESAYNVLLRTSDATADLQHIQVSFNRTVLSAQGRVSKEPSHAGKTLQLGVKVDRGRIDDLLLLFSGRPRPGMTGSVRIDANVVLPPAPPKFLSRLKLDGSFEIRNALFTNPATQSPLNYLSESADGEKKPEEREDGRQIPGVIHGAVHDSAGIARLSGIRYFAAGVNATVGGEFNIVSKAVDLRGVLATTGKLSDGTTGFKSILLHVARPFLAIHSKGKITTVAFTIQGAASHPVLSLSASKPGHNAVHLAHH